MTFENTSNEDLTELYKKKASELSYYNAAENESWYKERFMREHCRLMLAEIRTELQVRGVEIPVVEYLV